VFQRWKIFDSFVAQQVFDIGQRDGDDGSHAGSILDIVEEEYRNIAPDKATSRPSPILSLVTHPAARLAS
jgi:hypothetical protein